VDIGWTRDALDAGVKYLDHVFAGQVGVHLKKHRKIMTPYARAFAEAGRRSTQADLLFAIETAAKMYLTLGPILESHDILICPTLAIPAVKADYDHSLESFRVNGKPTELPPMLGWCMTTPFNTMSRCPVLAVPSGRAGNGVPTGIQIVGRTYCDADVLRAGMAYETAVGGWYRDARWRPKL
jgi:amidase